MESRVFDRISRNTLRAIVVLSLTLLVLWSCDRIEEPAPVNPLDPRYDRTPPDVSGLWGVPADSLAHVRSPAGLSWGGAVDRHSGISGYRVLLGSNPQQLTEIYSGAHTEFEASGLADFTKYYWRVVVFDRVGNESEGPVWHFYHPSERFVYIPPGTFTMGSPEDEPQRQTNEGPQHQVTLTKGFYMSKYEVTEEWWAEVLNETPTTSQLPEDNVSWDMAVQFCNALSAQEGLTPAYTIHGPDGDATWNQIANGYRLPTEAEWEYACRAGTTLAFHNNTNCLSSDTEANYDGNYPLTGCPSGVYRGARTVVGSFPANQWGLYDMHGNLFEWVWCGFRPYTNLPQVDPVYNVGPGVYRVVRGCNWGFGARFCRSAARVTSVVNNQHGFRPVRTVFLSP